jgi:hypothetical protein
MWHVGRTAEVHTGLWSEDMMERDILEDLDVDGRMILKWIFNKWDGGGKEWIALTQDRERWRALVNAVMNFRGP